MDDLKKRVILQKQVSVHAKYFKGLMDKYILDDLVSNYEGKCMNEGYVIPGSMKLLKRSQGVIKSNTFKGYITYNVSVAMDVINPVEGDIFKCEVSDITKIGFMAENDILRIAGMSYHNENSELFSNLEVGDTVTVEVIDSRFEFLGKSMDVMVKLIENIDPDVDSEAESEAESEAKSEAESEAESEADSKNKEKLNSNENIQKNKLDVGIDDDIDDEFDFEDDDDDVSEISSMEGDDVVDDDENQNNEDKDDDDAVSEGSDDDEDDDDVDDDDDGDI